MGNGNDDLALAEACSIAVGTMENNGELFPSNRLNSIWKLMRDFPLEDRISIMHRAYPLKGNGAIEKDEKFKSLFERDDTEPRFMKHDQCLSNYSVTQIFH